MIFNVFVVFKEWDLIVLRKKVYEFFLFRKAGLSFVLAKTEKVQEEEKESRSLLLHGKRLK